MQSMFKYFFSLLVYLIASQLVVAQSMAVNTDGSSADGSSIVDIKSESKGFLVPRMTLAQRTAISNPAKGLLVYQTDGTEGFYYNTGTSGAPNWVRLAEEKSVVAFSATSSNGIGGSGSFVKLQFNNEEFDEGNNFTGGATSEFAAPTAGLYQFQASFILVGGGNSQIALFVNGVQSKSTVSYVNNYTMSNFISALLKLNQGDKVDVRIIAPGFANPNQPNYIWFQGRKIN